VHSDLGDASAAAAAEVAEVVAIAGGSGWQQQEVSARQGSWEGLVALLPEAAADSDDWE
jgi:hypothetical protein